MINFLPHSDILFLFFEKNKSTFFDFESVNTKKTKLAFLDVPYNNVGDSEFHIIIGKNVQGSEDLKIKKALKDMEDSQYYFFDIEYFNKFTKETKKVRYTIYFTKILDAGFDDKTGSYVYKVIYNMTNNH